MNGWRDQNWFSSQIKTFDPSDGRSELAPCFLLKKMKIFPPNSLARNLVVKSSKNLIFRQISSIKIRSDLGALRSLVLEWCRWIFGFCGWLYRYLPTSSAFRVVQNSPEMNVSAQALSNACLNFLNGQFSTKLQTFEVSKISQKSCLGL